VTLGAVETALDAAISERGALLAVLLDPDGRDAETLCHDARRAEAHGADLLFVGGSYVADPRLTAHVAAIKAASSLPVLLFPGGASQVVAGFDAVLFLTLVSGRNPQYLIEEQVRGGLLVRQLGIEALPTAYVLVNSGRRTTVEYVSATQPIPDDKPKLTLAHAVAAEVMGMRWVYLDAGSGAEAPLSVSHIAACAAATRLRIIVGGGIASPELAYARAQAGADIVVMGSLWETTRDPDLLRACAAAVHARRPLVPRGSWPGAGA